MASEILIIDICGTLYRSNTTFDFIKFFFESESRYKIIDQLRKSKMIGKFNQIFFRITGRDLLRMQLIKLLRGYSERELAGMVSRFYEKYLLSRKNPRSFEVIERYRNQGAKLVLVSATLDIIADEISRRENIPIWAASELLFANGRCNGKLGYDLLRGKICRTLELTDGADFDVITDNYGDTDLIDASNHAYLVQYNNKRDKWSHYLNQEILKKCEFVRF